MAGQLATATTGATATPIASSDYGKAHPMKLDEVRVAVVGAGRMGTDHRSEERRVGKEGPRDWSSDVCSSDLRSLSAHASICSPRPQLRDSTDHAWLANSQQQLPAPRRRRSLRVTTERHTL